MATEQLSAREQECLEHLQKAQELGSSLTEYAAAFSLDVRELYAMKQQLVKKGAIAGRTKVEDAEKSAGFAPVRILPSAPPPGSIACRLTHPSGWVIECAKFPSAQWIGALMAGGTNAGSVA